MSSHLRFEKFQITTTTFASRAILKKEIVLNNQLSLQINRIRTDLARNQFESSQTTIHD